MSRTSAVRLIIALFFALGSPGVASAEVSEVRIATQYGIGYLSLTIMKHNKLIEKSLAQAGLGNTKVSWVKLGAGAAANDALLSDSLDFASGGTGTCVHPVGQDARFDRCARRGGTGKTCSFRRSIPCWAADGEWRVLRASHGGPDRGTSVV